MSYYRDTDYDPDQPMSDADAADTIRHRAVLAYQAARADVQRLTPQTDRDVVWRAKNRLYLAELAVRDLRESEAYDSGSAAIVREIRQGVA